jgi:hypothetical protein
LRKPYDLLNKCHVELRNSKLPTIDRLQLEMYILRAKIILLDDDSGAKSNYSIKSEIEIKELYEQISNLCGPEGNVADVGAIVERMQRLIEEMKKS